jgi:hypothetical protein
MIRYKVLLGRNVARSLRWLGLTPGDLRVTRPAPDESGRLPLPVVPQGYRQPPVPT